ncbi:hypothetical protein BSR29_01175 [Boudabousia liubingyangii]|uniref:Uncharacterized protein n=1 Tax=Boudabousia liubingyangii TaxID=1921764 RepID=A0A1Q5PQ19_9ACTO|nr:hypothetical protein [Boudabousia liubingyangii]OKL49599.1 hypothetical protein BSR29_01175 [Boudabousia liubingyangii]
MAEWEPFYGYVEQTRSKAPAKKQTEKPKATRADSRPKTASKTLSRTEQAAKERERIREEQRRQVKANKRALEKELARQSKPETSVEPEPMAQSSYEQAKAQAAALAAENQYLVHPEGTWGGTSVGSKQKRSTVRSRTQNPTKYRPSSASIGRVLPTLGGHGTSGPKTTRKKNQNPVISFITFGFILVFFFVNWIGDFISEFSSNKVHHYDSTQQKAWSQSEQKEISQWIPELKPFSTQAAFNLREQDVPDIAEELLNDIADGDFKNAEKYTKLFPDLFVYLKDQPKAYLNSETHCKNPEINSVIVYSPFKHLEKVRQVGFKCRLDNSDGSYATEVRGQFIQHDSGWQLIKLDNAGMSLITTPLIFAKEPVVKIDRKEFKLHPLPSVDYEVSGKYRNTNKYISGMLLPQGNYQMQANIANKVFSNRETVEIKNFISGYVNLNKLELTPELKTMLIDGMMDTINTCAEAKTKNACRSRVNKQYDPYTIVTRENLEASDLKPNTYNDDLGVLISDASSKDKNGNTETTGIYLEFHHVRFENGKIKMDLEQSGY